MWWWGVAFGQVVELPEEDVLASLRLRSMGGAITGLAESASANLYNPAAIGIRRPLAAQRLVDPDLALQARDHPLITEALALVGAEQPDPRRLSYFQLGANVRVGRVGFAAGWRETRVSDATGQEIGTFLASPGVGYAGKTMVVGLLPHVFGVQAAGRGLAVGPGATVGALWAPAGSSVRVGARARTPMRTGELQGEGPSAAFLPAEAAVGGSLGLGLTNAEGTYGPDRRRAERPTAGLLSADLVWTGASGEAVVLAESTEPATPSGWTVAGHAGAELWASRDRLRVRAGGGWLPGRGTDAPSPYATLGAGWQVLSDPRGFGWRLVTGGELYTTGPAVGLGLETW